MDAMGFENTCQTIQRNNIDIIKDIVRTARGILNPRKKTDAVRWGDFWWGASRRPAAKTGAVVVNLWDDTTGFKLHIPQLKPHKNSGWLPSVDPQKSWCLKPTPPKKKNNRSIAKIVHYLKISGRDSSLPGNKMNYTVTTSFEKKSSIAQTCSNTQPCSFNLHDPFFGCFLNFSDFSPVTLSHKKRWRNPWLS